MSGKILTFIMISGKNLKCGMCREIVPLSDISYVDARPEAEDSNDWNHIKVKGSHSTKIEAVVKQLLIIRAEDPTAKCLIFSTVFLLHHTK